MLYLSIFILPMRRKKIMAIALVESQFGPTSTPNLQFLFFCKVFQIFHVFSLFCPLAGNVVLSQCHSIAHVLALYFFVKADLSDLTRQDKKDPGQNGARTRWIQDKREPGQNGTRTLGNHKDNMEDNREP